MTIDRHGMAMSGEAELRGRAGARRTAATFVLLVTMTWGCGEPESPADSGEGPVDGSSPVCGRTRGLSGECGALSYVFPNGRTKWMAGIFAPSETAIEVERVRYELVGASGAGFCRTNLSHQIFVTTRPAGSPPVPNLEGGRTVAVPPRDDDGLADRVAEIGLDPPLRVEAGEQVHVLVEASATRSTELCLGSCQPIDDADRGRSWSSTTGQPPFMWEQTPPFPPGAGPSAFTFEVEGCEDR